MTSPIPLAQLCHRFLTLLASAKTTRSLSARQEAHSHVDFWAFGLEAFVGFAIGPLMSPAFSRHLTSNSAPFMSFGFLTYLTVDSEWALTLISPRQVTNALVLAKRKSLLQAIGVDLQVRWRGKNCNLRFLSGRSSLPCALAGATGIQYTRV
jgi:hypothetical protein